MQISAMETSWRDRVLVAPLWKWFLGYSLSGPLFGVLLWAFLPAVSVVEAVFTGGFYGVLFALVMTMAARGARRRDRRATGDLERSDRMQIARALRTGEPPSDTSLDGAMLHLIEHRRKQNRRARLFASLFLAAAVVLNGWAALHAHEGVLWIIAGLLTALLGVMQMLAWRAQVKLNGLEATINARARGSVAWS